MQTISQNKIRIGNFTSSEIAKITGSGRMKDSISETAFTYVTECNMERNLGRSVDTEVNSRPVTWGQLVEKRVFDLLGLEYQLISQETIGHPIYPCWAGSPDAKKFDENGDAVCDIKSPMTLKSFCQLVDPVSHGKLTGMDAMNAIRNGWKDSGGLEHKKHQKGDDYYWQLVSNAILTNSVFAELIVYVPYLRELEEIREMANMIDDEKQYRYRWINSATDDEIPFLIEGGKYKNITVIRFEVPEDDKAFLENRVKVMSKFLETV